MQWAVIGVVGRCLGQGRGPSVAALCTALCCAAAQLTLLVLLGHVVHLAACSKAHSAGRA